MHYVSTRGGAPAVDFEAALLAGLAPDGGLYVPDHWPGLSAQELRALAGRPWTEIAMAVMAPFVGDAFAPAELRALIERAAEPFSSRLVAPLRQIAPDAFLLEVFHGPTLAFKDVALQFLGHAFEAVLSRRGERLTIIGATSGDTGSAAIEALRGRERMEVVILHPEGRVSDVQRRQMTTADEPNIHNLAVHGTFDDCQRIVKELFADAPFRDQMRLSGVNSINWARIMAQAVYYVSAALALGAPERRASFVVPTGNFGDVLAGHVAAEMGLPVARLVIATNTNDILKRCLGTGRYELQGVVATSSPSMDIQVSSNFERLLFDASGRDPAFVRQLMDAQKQSNSFEVPPPVLARIKERFSAERASEDEVATAMRDLWREEGLLIDPHTAVGVVAMNKARAGGAFSAGEPVVVLSTAHPAKFPDAVRAATGETPPLPAQLAERLARTERLVRVPPDTRLIKDFIRSRVMPLGSRHGH